MVELKLMLFVEVASIFVSDNWVLIGSHWNDVIVSAMTSQIASLTIVYSTVYSGEDQRKHQSSASLAFVRGIRRWPVNSQRKWPVTRKMFPFDDVTVMRCFCCANYFHTWTIVDLSSISLFGRNVKRTSIRNSKRFIHQNAFENIVCEFSAILRRISVLIHGVSLTNMAVRGEIHIKMHCYER